MDEFQLLLDLHKHNDRQGPGGEAETLQALDLCRIDKSAPVYIADIGCGSGASTLTLAKHLNAQITAVDLLADFLDVLNERAGVAGLSEKIRTLTCSMDNLPFDDETFDVFWSEGAIYNIGFENGVQAWKRYLKPGGLLIASEIIWTTGSRPPEIQKHWNNEYPEIDTASSKMDILEKHGYSPIGYFTLPKHCWTDNYYKPLQKSFDDFLQRNGNSSEAQAIVEADIKEIKLYENYHNYYNYGFYIARKQG